MTIKHFTPSIILLSFVLFLACTTDDTKKSASTPTATRSTIPIDSGEIRIGGQVWMKKNLNVSRYRNGDLIPQVSDPTQWRNLTTGAWCYFANNTANGTIYGKLYNWFAVNDPRGLAPVGYHVPSNAEWTTLISFLGSDAGGKMKATTLWDSPNTGATNSSGFTGLPGGFRDQYGSFYDVGRFGDWSSSSEISITEAWGRSLYYGGSGVGTSYYRKNFGQSVRCLRD